MYTMILFLVLCLVFFYFGLKIKRTDWPLVLLIMGTVLSFLASFTVPGMVGVSIGEYEQITVEPRYEDIVALKDNTVIEGKMSGGIFIISGYIESKPCYYYYKKVGNAFQQSHIMADGVLIFEDAPDGEGYIVYRESYSKLTDASVSGLRHWVFLYMEKDRHTDIEIHVPEGTVVNEFTLDAE